MITDLIKRDLDELFGDTSVDVETTRSNLEDIREHIDMLLESLPAEED